MKKVMYEVVDMKSIWAVTIRILDKEAIMEALQSIFTGFTLEDAITTANARLNKFGFFVEAE